MSEQNRSYPKPNEKPKARSEVYRPTQYFLIGLAVMALGITLVAIERVI